ncbi:RIO-type serine/threonine-protein kinase Rio1 [uncultured archaeon]|nr:RIO-type serine/threonine-protein kinase Rio1 [uncultured archaeon]
MKVERKIESEVIDRSVLMVIAYMMNRGLIDSLDFPVSKGKEAYVFRAKPGRKVKSDFVAVKIYMIETSRFEHMHDYIRGDPRFRKIGGTKKDIVYAWTKKEFRNLMLMHESGVHVPEPYFFRNNLLAMEFIGDAGNPESPAKLLKDVGPPDPKRNFQQIVRDMKRMYDVGLVHGDLSEFNILVQGDKLVIIDVGQAVLLDHPMAEEFLRRDVANVVRFFRKFSIKADEEDILKKVKGQEKAKANEKEGKEKTKEQETERETE